MNLLSVMPVLDWFALVLFLGTWAGYVWFAKHLAQRRPSVLQLTNRYRRFWMEQSTERDPRMLDGIIVQNLSHSPSFFASTTIIIIGGLLAALGAHDKAAEVVQTLPFSEAASPLVFDLKMMLLLAIYVYAFFRFTWSLRQYTFVALIIGAMPNPKLFDRGEFERKGYADKAARLAGLAAETFNDGLRAYYFAFAAIGWLVSPWLLALGAVVVMLILYRREFHSDVLAVLKQD